MNHRNHFLRGVAVMAASTAAIFGLSAPAVADVKLSAGSPLCHQSLFKQTSVSLSTKGLTNIEFDSYQYTIRKGPRVYKLYTHSSGNPLSLSDPKTNLFVDGCGGGLPSIRSFDSNGSYAIGRFVFNGSTLFVDLGNSGRATETIGAINEKYGQLGYEGSIGLPTTDEQATPTKPGAYNHFTGGSIYWSPATGAHLIKGTIRDKWAAMGWERGDMGFPTTDELTTPNGKGKYNHFQNGWSIYWSPASGAHEVHGQIRDKWAALGWENSRLGFPTTDAVATSGSGQRQQFQNGCYIQWYPGKGATAYCTNNPIF
jgi:hypothetical protein